MIREKRIVSGKLLEVDFFPIYPNGRKMPLKRPKTEATIKAQQKYNEIQSRKKLVRLINKNFDESDYKIDPTFDVVNSPDSERLAKNAFSAYVRRVKRARIKKAKLLEEQLRQLNIALAGGADLSDLIKETKESLKKCKSVFKFVYRIEETEYLTGAKKGTVRYHFHGFMTGGLESKELEKLWRCGSMNADNYQPGTFGPAAAALYMTKGSTGNKKYICSKTMEKPDEKPPIDGKISHRKVELMAKMYFDDKNYWEKRYKGYKFVRCYARKNEYNGQYYISTVMYRDESIPWKEPEWLTSDYL